MNVLLHHHLPASDDVNATLCWLAFNLAAIQSIDIFHCYVRLSHCLYAADRKNEKMGEISLFAKDALISNAQGAQES